MIEPEKRNAIYCLHKEGMGIREIARRLGVSRNTVKNIINQEGNIPVTRRKDKIILSPELLHHLYTECNGWVQRIHEKLIEEEGIKIGYSTLTRMIRELGLGQSKNRRCGREPDNPGEELQHDTTDYTLKIGAKTKKVIGSLIYYRFSKMRYLKFYRSFNRFKMKCFFHEAMTHYEYTTQVCIIDNTSLARLRGTGRNAIIVPEMERFANRYGFEFICHEKGHANRKAGNERSFYTVETNFFPGRKFENIEDLNQQAFHWATIRMPARPMSKTGLIPAKAFEHEKAFLKKLPPYITPPYRVHDRIIDQYGYVSFEGNYFWVPGTSRHEVKVLEGSNDIKIYCKRELLTEYELPPDEVKNKLFSPKGEPKPKYQPNNRKRPTAEEEKNLRAAAREIDDYLNFALNEKGKNKHKFIRELYSLYRKITLPLFIKTVARALKYRITDMQTIERIASLQMRDGNLSLPLATIDEDFQNRETYREGLFSDKVDLSIYERMMEEDDE